MKPKHALAALSAILLISAAIVGLDRFSRLAQETSNLAAVGSGTWHDSMSSASAVSAFSGGSPEVAHVQASLSLPAGRVTALRVYMKSLLFAQGLSIGLYDQSNNLVASAKAPGTVGSNFWQEIDVANPVDIQSGTYKVAMQFYGNSSDFQFGGTTGNPSGSSYVGFSCPYGDSPCATLVTDSPLTDSYAVGAFLAASSGGGGTSDVQAPVISGVGSGSVTQSSAVISWSTDELADRQVEYGLTASYGNSSALGTSLSTSHSVSLSSLAANTTYNYRVKSRDSAGNLGTSGNYTFTTQTQGQDPSPSPTTYSLSVSKTGTGSGTVSGGSISCGSTCSQTGISSGTQITLTASAASGSTFTGWSGACSGTGSCVVSVTSNASVSAAFDAQQASSLQPPSVIGAKGVTSSQINIAWSTIEGETSSTVYTLYRNGSAITTRNAVDPFWKEPAYYQDTGLSPGTTYTYTVTAKNGSSGAESTHSPSVSATTKTGSSGLIPQQRIADWIPGVTVGVPGGIRNRTKLVDVTKAPYNADNTGATDAVSAINSAITAASAEDVIYLPAGTYKISSAIYLNRGNITLRGAGAGNTIIDCRASDHCIYFRGADFFNAPSYQVSSGATEGSTSMTISGGTYSVGQMLSLTASNDVTLPVISPSGYDHVQRQMVYVTGKSGSTVTFTPPIIPPFTSARTKVTPSHFANSSPFVGVEALTVDGTNGSVQNGITIASVYGAWIKDVKIKNAKNYNLAIQEALNCEVRHNYVDVLNHPANTPSGAGFLMDASTGCLIEDNIVFTGGAATTLFSQGDTGNVIAYNFMTSRDMNTNHGAQNSFNLYEGNITDSMTSDGYYGGESEATWFRNWITGKYVNPSTGSASARYVAAIKRFSRNFNFIGNVLGSSGLSAGYISFGQPNMGNASFTGWAAPSGGFYWLDWNEASGPGIKGTVMTRNSDSSAVITLTSGAERLRGYYMNLCGCSAYNVGLLWSGGARNTMSVTSFVGDQLTVDGGYPTALPPVGTQVGIWPRSEGFQERDIDTITTTLMKGNYRASASGGGSIFAVESLGGETLPNSLYLSSKPAWFGTLAWPPFNPLNPNQSYEAIPAGYRYINGGEAPGVSGSSGNTIPTSFTLTVLKSGLGSGTVSGGSVSCGSSCSQAGVSSGTQITLTATAASGSTFSGWSGGGCSGTSSTCTVTVSSNTTVTASFSSAQAVADTTLPTVSISSPANGATVSGTVSLSAAASDNVGVVSVQFKLDGANLGAELTTAPYSGSWNTTGVANGSHSLTATARDAAGNARVSAAISITVSNSAASGSTNTGANSNTNTGSGSNTTTSGGSGSSSGSNSTPTSSSIRLGIFTPTVPQKTATAPAAVCASGNAVFKRVLSIGSVGDDVKELQKLLNAQGFAVAAFGPGSRGNETSYYGPATAAAVKRFQEANRAETLAPVGLTTGTGVWGSLSQKKGNSLLPCAGAQSAATAQTVQTASIQVSADTAFTIALDIGSKGQQVILLQTLLSKLPNMYPEKLVTGTFGPLTQKAVGKFQESYGLAKPGDPAYGFVGPKTREKLNEALKTAR